MISLTGLSRDPDTWTQEIRTELQEGMQDLDQDTQDLAERVMIPLLPYHQRLPIIYPNLFKLEFAEYHDEFWSWVDQIIKDKAYPAFIAILPRGGGKSTNCETAVIELGSIGARKYCWYVRETQDQADKSVENIGALLEDPDIERYYPLMAQRAVGKYGKAKGWRRSRLITASGFTVDGMGIDKAVRGVKDLEQRPDLIILDDVDGLHDSQNITQKKIEILTDSIIPAGSRDVAVIFVQNMMIPDGVMSQAHDGRAEFLLDRVTSGPHKAVDGLAYIKGPDGLYQMTAGTPTWEGFKEETVNFYLNLWGPTSFMREAQHEVHRTGGFYDHIDFDRCSQEELPALHKTIVIVDPAITSTDKSDNQGILVDALGVDEIIYRLYAWEGIVSPQTAISNAILKGVLFKASEVIIETDQGGDTWKSVYRESAHALVRSGQIRGNQIPRMRQVKAGAGHGSKVHRGQQMLTAYELGRFCHVYGTHEVLERALLRFPKKPVDLPDAGYWGWWELWAHPRKIKPGSVDWYADNVKVEASTGPPQRSKKEIEEMLNG